MAHFLDGQALESSTALRGDPSKEEGMGHSPGQSAASRVVTEMTGVMEHLPIPKQRIKGCCLRLETLGNLVCKC